MGGSRPSNAPPLLAPPRPADHAWCRPRITLNCSGLIRIRRPTLPPRKRKRGEKEPTLDGRRAANACGLAAAGAGKAGGGLRRLSAEAGGAGRRPSRRRGRVRRRVGAVTAEADRGRGGEGIISAKGKNKKGGACVPVWAVLFSFLEFFLTVGMQVRRERGDGRRKRECGIMVGSVGYLSTLIYKPRTKKQSTRLYRS